MIFIYKVGLIILIRDFFKSIIDPQTKLLLLLIPSTVVKSIAVEPTVKLKKLHS